MLEQLSQQFKQLQFDSTDTKRTLLKLKSLQLEAKKAFDERFNQFVTEMQLTRKIQVPKTSIKSIPINWRYLLSIPFIYGMIFPLVWFHAGIELYQQICFRLYGIPRVNAKEYFIYDRKLLSWLNPWEKVNCIYCSYANNLIRYASEISGRTERYWCPIKYYKRINHAHSQYNKFAGTTDPKKLRQQWELLRDFSDLN